MGVFCEELLRRGCGGCVSGCREGDMVNVQYYWGLGRGCGECVGLGRGCGECVGLRRGCGECVGLGRGCDECVSGD